MSSLESLRQACLNPPSQPTPEALRAASEQVMTYMRADFQDLPDKAIGLSASRHELEMLLGEPPPEQGTELGSVLAEFHEKIMPHAFRVNHPRFWAFIPGAPSFASILGECLATSTNFFAGVWKEAAGPAQIEIVVLDWFKRFLGYPSLAGGVLTSGGSEANLTALVVARDQVAFDDRQRIVLYASEHRHWSVDRAARIIGLAPHQLRPLPCDEEHRLEQGALDRAIADDKRADRVPWLVLASAGTTNTGSVDPLANLADLCAQHRLWLHVDAAYGWPMALVAEGKALLAGIERADSITLDPHKWFAQPFESGCVLVRRGELLPRTFSMRPEYMQDVVPGQDEINFCDQGISLTRRFRALKIWLSVKVLGLAWHRRMIQHDCSLAAYAQALLEASGRFEITSSRRLSILCFRFVPTWAARGSTANMNDLQQAIAAELLRTGRAFLSTTRLNGTSTLRFCFINWRTTAADVEEIVQLIADIGMRLEGAFS